MASLLPTPEPADPVEGALGHFEHTNWVKASLKALDAGTVHAAAGVAGSLIVDGLTVDNSADQTALISLKGNSVRSIIGRSASDFARWQIILGDGTAEGGGNSGSLFKLYAFTDTGGVAHTVLDADRMSGLVKVKGAPVADTGVATKKYVDDAMPIGAIIAFGGNAAPPGWHLCNGSVHGSTALQSVIGSLETPDLTSRFIIGASPTYPVGAMGGAASVKLTAAESGVPAHDHAASATSVSTAHTHTASTQAAGAHTHGGWTGAMDRATVHKHGAGWMEGAPNANDDGDVLDSTGPSQGYVRWSLYTNDTNTNHLHSITSDGSHSHTVTVASGGGSHTHTVDVSLNTAAAAAVAHENRPPYYALTYIIKKA